MFELGRLALLEAAKLLFFADLQPEFYKHHIAVHQLLFEVVDFGIAPRPVRGWTESLHALDQHATIPGAVEDGYQPRARHVSPEPPQVGLGAFFLGRGRHRHDMVTPRIERGGDAPYRRALTGGIHAFKQQYGRAMGELLFTR